MANKPVDVAAIRAAITVSDVVRRYMEIKKAGAEWRARCPFHDEKTPSFSINDAKHLWCCFGCNAKGDQIDFVAKHQGLQFREAAAVVMSMAGLGTLDGVDVQAANVPPPKTPKRERVEAAEDAPISPVPLNAAPPDFKHRRHGQASRTWTYRNAAGELVGYVCRFDRAEGGKEVLPLSWTARGWQWKAFAQPRPLYGLELLGAAADANVVIVEGEKACDAARGLFPAAVVVTWPGGGKAVKHADLSPLRGRKVVIWPDWDRKTHKKGPAVGEIMPPLEQAGMLTALELADALEPLGCQVRIAWPPATEVDGWDAADAVAEGWTPERAGEWMRSSLRTLAQVRGGQAVQADPTPPAELEPPPDNVPPDLGEDEDEDRRAPFQALGYDHGEYFYLARGARQVLKLSGAGHTKGGLLMLAPLQHWEREFPSKGGANWDAAANALIRMSERAGVYDAARVRGRGAWWEQDERRAVLHLGDHLVVGGQEFDLAEYRSRFIYEAAAPLRINAGKPLSSGEAVELVEICKMLPWEKPIHATLLAGWCVIAPICGALKWRPHIWVTGPAGSGKSWVYENILVRCLGDIALAAASETTEAGLRQVLGTDARPVVFDEAEGETGKAQQRIQNVLALMRQASSETSAAIYKGSASGDGVRYLTRSCFAFSSIGVGLQQHADTTRVSVLSLTIDQRVAKEERAARFARVEERWLRSLTPEFVDRLHARTVSLIPVIRKNAETFAVAGASVIGTRRLGDQLGALIAGAYSLHSGKEITLEEARTWLERQDWTEEAQIQEQRDEVSCLQHILQRVVQVPTDKGRHDRSLGELVRNVVGDPTVVDMHVSSEAAHDVLKRHGLRVDNDALAVANNHTALARILSETAWGRNWKLILRRLPGATLTGAMRFGGSAPDRAVAIPLASVFGEHPLAGTQMEVSA